MNLEHINAVDISFGSSGFKMLIATMYDCHQVRLGCASMQDVCVCMCLCVCMCVCACVYLCVCVHAGTFVY